MEQAPRRRSVCVFCGSSRGADPRFAEAAQRLGRLMAQRGQRLVFGGGSVGLMGVLSDALLEAGGDAVGVIPHGLAVREVAHRGLRELRVVPTMHARKALMAELAEAFAVLPGGYGTFEEAFEIVTWAQLGIHRKPIALLNLAGYFDALLQFLDRAVADGFVRPEYRGLFAVAESPAALLEALDRHEPPEVPRWLSPGEE
jgi:uncharacterized protein (TIGR00730 family)